MSLGGLPSEFLKQTPKSLVIAMEGMARAANREADLSIHNAWHTAIFALSGYAGKLKGKQLSDYLSSDKPGTKDHNLSYAQGIAFFTRLREQGMPVEITVTRH